MDIHSNKGKKVVDYVIVPMECLDICSTFKDLTADSFINEYCNIVDLVLDLPGTVPDHSVLMPTININIIVDSDIE